jgi:hypothetical protein
VLKTFLYLNEPVLDGYLSALEDGLRASVQAKTATTSSISGKVGVGGVGAGGDRESQKEETTSRTDTASARFERLQKLAKNDVEASGWIDVIHPDTDLKGIGIGALIELECEIYIPEILKALAPNNGLAQAIEMMQALSPFAASLGGDMSSLPDAGQLDAVKGFANTLGGAAVLVGEPDDTEWRVAGKLVDAHLRGEIEGHARVVGKVSAVLADGAWKPLLALPGMNLLSRDKRREMERKGPDEGQEDNWLQGPAIMLDVLAVYR